MNDNEKFRGDFLVKNHPIKKFEIKTPIANDFKCSKHSEAIMVRKWITKAYSIQK